MAELVNLNKARKARARAEAERLAAENRVRHGRTKAQKQQDAAETDAMRRRLDGLKLDPPADA
ncbi:MAG: DUF4169 family protein [Stagnimonas sp.]|nr:DUF4169 family protein [Stagnimonas sp.]